MNVLFVLLLLLLLLRAGRGKGREGGWCGHGDVRNSVIALWNALQVGNKWTNCLQSAKNLRM